ncbi:major capsid protein P2 [Thalassospira sp. SM2505]
MTNRISKKMPNGSGIGAGQTATFNLPLGVTYHQLLFRIRADLGAGVVDVPKASLGTVLGEIRLYIDGQETIRVDAADLAAILTYKGQVVKDGALPLMFSDPAQRTPLGEDAPAIGTADIQSLSLEVDIKAGVTSPSLTVYGVLAQNAPLGQFYAIKKYPFNVGNTGIRELQDLPRHEYHITKMHISTDAISSVQVEANQRILRDFDRVVGEASAIQTGKAWQAGWTHIDFTISDRLSDFLPMLLEDFRVRLDMTSTGNFNLYTEEIRGKVAA